MKKVSKTFYTKVYVCFVIFLLFVCILQGFIYEFKPNENLIEYGVDMSKGWKDKDGNSITLSPLLSNDSIKYGKINTIYYKIGDDIKPGYTMCFRSLSTSFKAYIDNKLILETKYIESPLFNKSTGSQWHFYTFTEKDIGKTITIKMDFFYNDTASYFENMTACYQQDYIIHAVVNKLSELIIAFFIFSIGCFITIIGLYTKIQLNLNRDILVTLGLFSCNLATWITFETHLIELFFDASAIVHLVCCNMLLFLPITFVQFLAHLFDKKYLKYCNICCLLSSFIFILTWILNITNIQDFHESLYLTFISIVGSCLICLVAIIVEALNLLKRTEKHSKDKELNKSEYIKILAFGSFFVCLVIDFTAYYFVPQNIHGLFSRSATIYSIIMCILIAIKNIVNLSEEFIHASAMTKVAYHDILTGLYNRTAYKERIDTIKQSLNTYDTICFVVFDINDLKYVNDNLGHNYGDELIISASSIIQSSFTEASTIYRIGGDEFVAIISSSNCKQIYKQSALQFKINIQNFNNFYNKPYTLSIAHGASYYTKNSKQTIDQIIEYADHEMYENKLAYKKAHSSKDKSTKKE